MKPIVALGMAVLLGVAGSAHAAPVTFFGEDTNNGNITAVHPKADAARNSFFANLTGVGTETFESYAPNTVFPLTITFPGAGTAVLTGTGFIEKGNSPSRQFAISGSQYVDTNNTFTLTFASPVSAFGFYATDIGDVQATLKLDLTGSNGTSVLTVPDILGPTANGSALYYGFYDTANTYTKISFVGAGNDIFGFDDFSIGSREQVAPAPVPEPLTWMMMIVGLGTIGAGLRRRQRTAVHFA